MKKDIFNKIIADEIFEIIKAGDIKRKQLLEKLNPRFSDRTLRIFIDLMIERGYLIGTSSSRGYFLISKEEDYLQAMSQLKKQAAALYRRANVLHKNFKNVPKDIQFNFLFTK